jgi:hypothetical protein
MFLSLIGALAVLLAAAHVAAATSERRMTNASNVRVRSAPVTSASIEAELPLGSELVTLERTSGSEPWYHVKTDDGHDGWVLGRLTTPFDIERRDQIIESIVVGRLQSGGSFSTLLQLFDLIERTAARLNDREAQARFALHRLRSMSSIFGAVPFRRGDTDPYAGWIREHQDAARYNEPGGQWMVDPSYVKEVHEKRRDTAAADDIAWFFVVNGLYGECEGDVPCYVNWQNQLNGWYLQSHPRGRHTDESDAHIAVSLNAAMDNLRRFPLVLGEFNPKTRCGELHLSLDPLTAAVIASVSARKVDALAAIERFAQLCR